ncbi:MAG TPA: hypothetical protein V6D07_01055 [Trichocoleus sp.]
MSLNSPSLDVSQVLPAIAIAALNLVPFALRLLPFAISLLELRIPRALPVGVGQR